MTDDPSSSCDRRELRLRAARHARRRGRLARRSSEGESLGLVGESGAGKSHAPAAAAGPRRARARAGSCSTGSPLDLRDRALMRALPRGACRRSSRTPTRRWTLASASTHRGRAAAVAADRDGGRAADARVAEALASVGLAADTAVALPPRVLRRPAPADRDRPGHRLPAARAARRRAGERARCHHAQSGHRPARASCGASRDLTLLMVSHDLGVVAALCERTIVLREGRIVEQGTTSRVLGTPREAYTRQLLAAVPRLPEVRPDAG